MVYNLGLLFTCLTSFFLIFIVYFKARERKLSRIFILINLSGAIWSGGLFIFHIYSSPNIFLLRLAHLGIIFLPVLYLHFLLSFFNLTRKKRKFLLSFYGLTFFLVPFSFSKLYVSSIIFNPVLGYVNRPGPLYYIFEGIFLFAIIYGCLLLIKGLRKVRGFRRSQIRYYLLGSILGLGGGATTFLPLFGINIPPVGIYLVPLYGICITYAIVRYRLMEIRLVLRKGIIYFLTTSFVTTFIIVILFLFTRFYHQIIGFKSFSLTVIFAFLLALILQPLREKIEFWIDKLFYQRRVNYYSTLKDATRKLVSILEMSELLNFIVNTPIELIGIESGQLLLLNEEENNYEVKVSYSSSGKRDKKKVTISGKKGLVKILKDKKDFLLKEYLFSVKSDPEVKMAKEQLRRLHSSLVFPLVFQSQILGILSLGEKVSGEAYSKDDLELLSLFAGEAGIALKNAQLFWRIKEMKSYNERILENMSGGLIGLDSKGRIFAFNKKAEDITGLPTSNILGKRVEVLKEPLATLLKNSLRKGEIYSGLEVNLSRGNGKNIPVSISTSRIGLKRKEKEIIVILNDLSERKGLERQIRQAEKLASLGTLAARMAHEIKNPLVSIRTFAELLPSKFKDKEFREQFSSLALEEVERIDNLITKLLNFTRSKDYHFEVLSVEMLIEESLSSLQIQISKQNIKVRRDYLPDIPSIYGDKEELKQVFLNILTNSVEVMPEGGEIFIATRKKKERGELFVSILFSDTGGGIPQENLDKIFDPFFTTKVKGSGLGLFISYKIIHEHHGNIQVRNIEKGAEFSISLPAYKIKEEGKIK